jgi:site-specific recombinase XerD
VQIERIAASVDVGDIRALAESWRISLQAHNLSPKTIGTYTESLESFIAFVTEHGMPTLAASVTREHVDAWLADLATQWRPATVRNRYTGVKQFFSWANAEGEIAETPMRNMSPPLLPEGSRSCRRNR